MPSISEPDFLSHFERATVILAGARMPAGWPRILVVAPGPWKSWLANREPRRPSLTGLRQAWKQRQGRSCRPLCLSSACMVSRPLSADLRAMIPQLLENLMQDWWSACVRLDSEAAGPSLCAQVLARSAPRDRISPAWRPQRGFSRYPRIGARRAAPERLGHCWSGRTISVPSAVEVPSACPWV